MEYRQGWCTGLGGSYSHELRIEHDEGVVETVVYNRSIVLLTTDSDTVRWIHQVCCRLDDLATRHRRA